MKFRLTYEGLLRPTQRDPIGDQRNPLAKHKHEIRKQFHVQLKQLWATNKMLKEHQSEQKVEGTSERIKIPLVQYIANQYHEFGYRFVPLVREEYYLLCSLDILFLRRDIPGSILQAGDIDNRLKTVIDALRRPRNARELEGYESPSDGEDPFYCLLEDDSQVAHFSVETDTLLDPPTDPDADYQRARLVITVEIRPYRGTWFSLGLV